MKIYLILLSIQSSTAYLLDETENLEDGGNFVNGFLWIRNFLETKLQWGGGITGLFTSVMTQKSEVYIYFRYVRKI